MPFDFRTVFQRALPYSGYLQHYGTEENRARWGQVYDAVSMTQVQKDLLQSFRRRMNVLCLAGAWCGDCVNACPIYQRIAEACPLVTLRFVNRVRDFEAALKQEAGPKPGTADDPADIRSSAIGKILVKWGILTPERVDKALLAQEERKARGLNVRIGDVMTDMGYISAEQRDKALAAQSGYGSIGAWDVEVAKELSICGGPRVPVLVYLSEDWFECERFGERTLATYRDKARKKLSNMEGATCPTGLMTPETDVLAANVAEWLTHFERVQWMLLTSPRLS
ncbi:MAG TPA: thioredoxin family protein, partial [Phycisphaerae bacterium]